eukprot:7046059-Pyramimonas_sp.AAC.1
MAVVLANSIEIASALPVRTKVYGLYPINAARIRDGGVAGDGGDAILSPSVIPSARSVDSTCSLIVFRPRPIMMP